MKSLCPRSAGHTTAICWKKSQSPCIFSGGAGMITNDRCINILSTKISNILNSASKIKTFYLLRQIFNFHKYETPSFSFQAPDHKSQASTRNKKNSRSLTNEIVCIAPLFKHLPRASNVKLWKFVQNILLKTCYKLLLLLCCCFTSTVNI